MITLKQTIKQVLCISIALFSLSSFGSPKKFTQTHGIQLNFQKETLIKRTYKLKKFTQSCCSKMIEYSLQEVDGFIKQESNIETQEITVWYDSEKCTEDQIKAAINKTSYTIIED